MPESWQDEQALKQRSQSPSWKIGSGGERIVPGRIIRAASRPSTSTAKYWDVVLLALDHSEININVTGTLTLLPVRPYVSDVADPIGSSNDVGSVVSVRVKPGGNRVKPILEDGTLEEDWAEVLPGQHAIVASGGGGGGCAQSFTAWGSYFDD